MQGDHPPPSRDLDSDVDEHQMTHPAEPAPVTDAEAEEWLRWLRGPVQYGPEASMYRDALLRLLADRARAQERIRALEALGRSYLAFVEHVENCENCLAKYSRDHTQLPDNDEARALLGEAPDGE